MKATVMLALSLCLCHPLAGQFTFDNVEARTAYGAAKEGNSGKLIIDAQTIRFTKNKGDVYFSIPTKGVSDLFYSRVSGRRIGAAILVTPFLLFSKGRKHYMTVTFNDGANAGAVEFKLHKDNYRGVLRTVEQATGLTMVYDQEGVKDSEQTVATRSTEKPTEAASGQGTLEIKSVPEGPEIEINGAFVGNAPRLRSLAPGEYAVRLKKKGYKDWERKVSVAAGETLTVTAEMEQE
jgi:hypothetical protein